VQGGLSFYLNQGLFVSFKGYYGLSDITRNEADYSVLELNDDQSLIFKSDDDRNITLQASVGFHF
jgi:lipocalin